MCSTSSVGRLSDRIDGYAVQPAVAAGRAHNEKAWFDAVGVSILALLLLPAILTNALLWYEYLSGIGLYDPAAGGDPAWKHRPLLIPVLVAHRTRLLRSIPRVLYAGATLCARR